MDESEVLVVSGVSDESVVSGMNANVGVMDESVVSGVSRESVWG